MSALIQFLAQEQCKEQTILYLFLSRKHIPFIFKKEHFMNIEREQKFIRKDNIRTSKDNRKEMRRKDLIIFRTKSKELTIAVSEKK